MGITVHSFAYKQFLDCLKAHILKVYNILLLQPKKKLHEKRYNILFSSPSQYKFLFSRCYTWVLFPEAFGRGRYIRENPACYCHNQRFVDYLGIETLLFFC